MQANGFTSRPPATTRRTFWKRRSGESPAATAADAAAQARVDSAPLAGARLEQCAR
jgi:hypothetical protein